MVSQFGSVEVTSELLSFSKRGKAPLGFRHGEELPRTLAHTLVSQIFYIDNLSEI